MRRLAAVTVVGCLLGASGQAHAAGHGCTLAARAGQEVPLATATDFRTGHMRCAQYLSTTTVMRPAHDQRT